MDIISIIVSECQPYTIVCLFSSSGVELHSQGNSVLCFMELLCAARGLVNHEELLSDQELELNTECQIQGKSFLLFYKDFILHALDCDQNFSVAFSVTLVS